MSTSKKRKDYAEALSLAREKYLLQVQETWIHIQRLVRAYSFIGLLLTTVFGAIAYIVYGPSSMSRLVFMSAAMGSLVSASVGINIASKLSERKRVPYLGFLLFLATVIALLLLGFIKGKEVGVTNLWPSLGSALYTSIMVGIVWRLRATNLEFNRLKEMLERQLK